MRTRNIVSWNTLIIGYAKKSNMDAANKLFDEMHVRDVISWTFIITGYSHTNQFKDDLKVFEEMMKTNVRPNKINVTTVLSTCAHTGSLDVGTAIHDYIRKHDIKPDIRVGNSLIDMYCKCGRIKEALQIFQEIGRKDIVSWTSLINGLSVNGYVNDAINFFSQMLKEGVQPSDLTFIGVLLGCSHAGLVDEGLKHFESMRKVHRVEPNMKHYGCVVDLLSCSGNLDKAYKFIQTMLIAPDVVQWRILLGARKLYNNVDMALSHIHSSSYNIPFKNCSPL